MTDVNSNLSSGNGEVPCEPYECAQYNANTPSQPLSELMLEDNIDHPRTRKANLSGQHSPFDFLPTECILIIFSCLTQLERGRCMLVSKRWYELARSPIIWRVVNLREFSLCYGHSPLRPKGGVMDAQACTKQCWGRYMTRIDRYICFLIDIKPKVRILCISFDFASNNWLNTVSHLFRFLDLGALLYLDIDWHDTPAKPVFLMQGPHYRLNDLCYATRRRQRVFLAFMREFITDMTSVQSLVMPFNWSYTCMKYFAAMTHLRNLVLKKYILHAEPQQDVLDGLVHIQSLEKLLIEVWNPSCNKMRYHIRSPTLKYLDLSQCKGFYLDSVHLPVLEVIKLPVPQGRARAPAAPCLCEVLRAGAPLLKLVNRVVLSPATAASTLMSVCPSLKHEQCQL